MEVPDRRVTGVMPAYEARCAADVKLFADDFCEDTRGCPDPDAGHRGPDAGSRVSIDHR